MIKILLLMLGSIAAWSQSIERVKLEWDQSQDQVLVESLKQYLSRFIGADANENNILAAENFLLSLRFVSSSYCRIEGPDLYKILVCKISPKYLISAVNIDNLAASLLESELKRKLPLQIGLLVDIDEKTLADLMEASKIRTETFLKKNGFYGAKVSVLSTKNHLDASIQIYITIEGGAFMLVSHVDIEGDSPVSSHTIRMFYQRMCFSFNRIFDSISSGSLSCYSRELEGEATARVQERLAKMGYLQARIRVVHEWIKPNQEKIPKKCRNLNPHDLSPRCVNLKVIIDKGPKVSWSINIIDGTMVSRGALSQFFGSIFLVDQFSRATESYQSETSQDQQIIKQELEKRISFIESNNIDEQEVRYSAQKMRDYLIKKGYTNAEVLYSYKFEDPRNIKVDFSIYSGQTYYIQSVRIEPPHLAGFFSVNELEELVKTRSIFEQGQLSYDDILSAGEVIKHRLSGQGFHDVGVKFEILSLASGGISVVFYLTSSLRELVDELVIINGDKNINSELLAILKNCTKYNQILQSCIGSPLDRDSVANDAQKITDFYRNRDYLYARVKSEIQKSKSGYNLIFYLYDERFDYSDYKLVKQKIKNIIISGNKKTSEKVIRRLFPGSGEVTNLDHISLRKGIANLRESSQFSQIDPKIIAGQENSDDAYLALHLTERSTFSLDTSLSFSTDQLLILEAEAEETNLFRSMLRLNTGLGLGLFWGRQSFFNNKFIWPFMLGKPLRFTLHAPIIAYDDKSNRKEPSRRLQSKIMTTFEWRLSTAISPYFRYLLVHTLEQKFANNVAPKLSMQDKFSSLDGLIPTLRAQGTIRGVLKPGIVWVSLDNPRDPHRGIDTNNWLELSGGPLIGEPAFINIGTQDKFYLPIGSCTVAIHTSFMRAFISPNEKNWTELKNGSSMDDLGGDRTLRGYEDGFISNANLLKNFDTFAGYFSNIANIEFRFPLSKTDGLGNLSGALFVDQGSVIECSSLFGCFDNNLHKLVNTEALGLSVGTGLRYNLPVGPISLDYAISPIHKQWRIHLQFGYAF